MFIGKNDKESIQHNMSVDRSHIHLNGYPPKMESGNAHWPVGESLLVGCYIYIYICIRLFAAFATKIHVHLMMHKHIAQPK